MADHLVFKVEDNWLPKSWVAAQTKQFPFTDGSMNTVYDTVCTFYELWRSELSDESKTTMEVAVKKYLNVASREKELIRKKAWGEWGEHLSA